MSRSYSSNWESVGSSADPDIIYYNASIINNTTDDQTTEGNAFYDPLVKFNETRSQPIIRDASQYQFSIIRFVVNGPNKDLPLFIPAIQSFTGQTDPNLTEYGVGISALVEITLLAGGTVKVGLANPITYVSWIPEVQNNVLAPVPNPPSSPYYVGIWNNANGYNKDNIVSVQVLLEDAQYYQAQQPVPVGASLTQKNLTGSPDPTSTTYNPNYGKPYWAVASSELGRPQDVSTRYYWAYTFQHWTTLVQNAIESANSDLYQSYLGAVADVAGVSSYATYALWKADYPTPIISYDIPSGLFNIIYGGKYLLGTAEAPGLWFNQNMEGLISNFLATYYNTPAGDGSFATATVVPATFPSGYVWKLEVQVQNGGANTAPVTSIYPTYSATTPNVVVKMTEECQSTSSLWSPIESIVFLSNLLPIQNEQTAPPNTYGMGNIGNSQPTAQAAFQPIITDIANDLAGDPFAYRKMIYYAPVAEYRMSDFQNSKTEIKTIDIQVFWKNRLNNQLYPLSMYNLSSVSIKIMFRKKSAYTVGGKSQNIALY